MLSYDTAREKINKCLTFDKNEYLCNSDLLQDVTYGGVDNEGTVDPASRQMDNVWDDEEL